MLASATRPKVLMLLPQDWFFLSHFLDRAMAARDAGFEVVIAARDDGDGERIRRLKFPFYAIQFNRRGINPISEILVIRRIHALYREIQPDLIHHVAMKPILYGTVAARLLGFRRIINAPVGMGYVFSSDDLRARMLRPFVVAGLKAFLNPQGSHIITENSDDHAAFVKMGAVDPTIAHLIRGAGVDTSHFHPAPLPPEGTIIVTLVARALRDKGIREYVAAARQLRIWGIDAVFRLVGGPDAGNPASCSDEELAAWHRTGDIEWLGPRKDVPELLRASHIATLPSYREGLPKSLMEAMSVGLPVVVTDVPGCRELVEDGVTGLLVPPKNPDALAVAIARLVGDATLRTRLGTAARALIKREFSTEEVCQRTLSVYRAMLTTSTA